MADVRLSLQGQGTIEIGSGSIAPGTVGAASIVIATIADASALAGDRVVVSPTAALAVGLMLGAAYVAANGTISIPVINPTAAGVAGGTPTINYALLRS